MCYHKSCFEVIWNETGCRSIITVIFFSITNLKVFISINVYSAIFATCYFRLSTLVNGFIPSWLRSDTVLKWIDTFSNKHTYLKTSCIYLRIVLISTSLKFVGPLATRAKWTIIKRGQIIPCRYWVKQQIDIVIHPSVLIPSASPSTSSLANGFWSATLLTWSETLGEQRWSF